MKNSRFAQSATELALFGAILIFIIGLIARSSLQSALAMNMQIKAVRLALAESYRTAQGQYSGSTEATARNSASLIILQDRLSVAAGTKTGTRDRIPFVTSASATMSHTLYDPPEFNDARYLPMTDIFINGQRFPLTTAAWEEYELAAILPECDSSYAGGELYKEGVGSCYNKGDNTAYLYKQAGNYPKSANWDATKNYRFDYDFDGTPDNVGGPANDKMMWQWVLVRGVVDRDSGILIDKKQGISVNTSVDVDGDKKEEAIFEYLESGGKIIKVKVLDYQNGDIDLTIDSRDAGRWFQAETVAGPCSVDPPGPDTTCSLSDPSFIGYNYARGGCVRWKCLQRKVGIDTENIQSYTYTTAHPRQKTGKGTYLRIQEGKLYGDDNQYVRDTNRNDQVDIFERALFLTKDTERFCKGGTPVAWPTTACEPSACGLLGPVCGLKNPVEACGDSANHCFSGNKTDKTCMQTDANIIFVRSRIEDVRGRRWVRRVTP